MNTRIVLMIILALGVLMLLAGCASDSSTAPPVPTRTPSPVLAAEGPPCQFIYWGPYHDTHTTCVEIVLDEVTPPEAAPALMGLAFGPDGTLYMARTAQGEIWAMRDTDGDQFLDALERVADGLALPTGIAWYNGALYVASVGGVIRLDASGAGGFETPAVLVDDLPGDTGFWPGGVGIGPDGRLYVSVGAACFSCEDDPGARTGMVLSYALDGSDRRVEATGLGAPADFAWHPDTGELWIVDSARILPGASVVDLPAALIPPDELNRLVAGADYGYPACIGTSTPDSPCAQTEPPAVTFPYQSRPAGLAFYPSDAFPFWQGDLIVALGGSWTLPEPEGYAVAVIGFDGGEPDGSRDRIAPVDIHRLGKASLAALSLSRQGFFPYHPVDVAISVEGWIYVSMQEGRIFRFRPRPAAQ